MTRSAVHIPADNEIVWRLAGSKDGKYEMQDRRRRAEARRTVVVSAATCREFRRFACADNFWERMFSSAEPALPENSPIESISINYPDRNIEIAGYGMNWIWLFFILSMVAGFIFKELLGIKI